jgi:hypothetical protein
MTQTIRNLELNMNWSKCFLTKEFRLIIIDSLDKIHKTVQFHNYITAMRSGEQPAGFLGRLW